MRVRAWCLWVALAWMLSIPFGGAPLVHAQEGLSTDADEADVQFQLGNKAYKKRDYRRALSHYFASYRLVTNRNVLFNVARCYEQQKKYVEAYRYYKAFETAGPLKAAQKRVATKALNRVKKFVSLLRIASQPPGAKIYLNRRELGSYGQTPALLALAPGSYLVLLEKEGFGPWQKDGVAIDLGGAVNLEVRMDRLVGKLNVAGEPAGALVQVDDSHGPQVGNLPASLTVSPGQHRVLVTREGYIAQELRAEVKAGQQTDLSVKLKPQTGSILVQADERDALIRDDGTPVGFTPAVIDGLRTGDHEVQVEQDGFRTFATQVSVEPDKQATVVVQMEIDEDVAAASRMVERSRDAAASVTLIGKRELRAFGYTDAVDAVQGVRGVYYSDDQTYKSLGFRGFSPFGDYGNRNLVLIDGHTLNDDWIGSSYVSHDLLTDLYSVERMEVVRGPGSVLYGTGAMFGVLNLVTRQKLQEDYVSGGLSAIGPGVLRTWASGGLTLGEDAGFWISAGGLHGQAGDYFSPARLGEVDYPDGVARGVGETNAASVLGKLYWQDLTLQFYYNLRERQVPTGSFETIFGDRRTHSDDTRSFVELRYEPELGESIRLLSRLYYDHYGYSGAFPYDDAETGVAREYYLGDWAGAEARLIYSSSFGLRVTGGALYEMHFANPGQGSDASGEYYHELHPYQVFSGYLVADYTPVKWLSISLGGRFDGWLTEDLPDSSGGKEDSFTHSVNPRLGLVLRPTDYDTIKLLAGRAFRAPSLYELTYWDGGTTQVPSPDLTPETIYSGELEYSHRLPQGFWIVGAVFLNYMNDMVVQLGDGDETDPLHYQNSDDAIHTIGGELELRREFRRGWMMAVQYSYQRTRFGAIGSGDEPPNSPAHLAGGKLIVPLAGRSLRLATRLVFESGRLDRDGRRTDPAVLWDLLFSGDLESLHMHYVAGVRNLLDWDYRHPVGEDLLDPRVRQAGLTFTLDLGFRF